MDSIGLGLIGCGSRLRGITGLVQKTTDRARVVALYDPSEDSIRKAKEQFNPDAKVYEDYRELVRDPAVDWVMIGSWNCFHAEQAIAAFEAGKHVFCEKPLATNIEDCVAMRDAWRKSGRLFTIGFTLRYSPHYIKIKELLDSGYIGELVSMEFNETLHFNHGGYIHSDWRRKTENAGTHLLEKCCHDLDLTNWMVGSLAERVASFGGCNFFLPKNAGLVDRIGPDKEGRPAFTAWHLLWGSQKLPDASPFGTDKDIVDNQVAVIEFANKVRATFHANCAAGIYERRMVLCGSEGAIRADVITGKIEGRRFGYDDTIDDLSTEAKGGHGGGDNILGESLVATMLEGMPPRTTLEDGLRSAITAFAIDDAMGSGTVVDVKPYWEKAGIPG